MSDTLKYDFASVTFDGRCLSSTGATYDALETMQVGHPGLQECFEACDSWYACVAAENNESENCYLRYTDGAEHFPSGWKSSSTTGTGIGEAASGNGETGWTCYKKGILCNFIKINSSSKRLMASNICYYFLVVFNVTKNKL